VNTYFMQQTVMSFASAAARTTALSTVLAEGMVSYLQDTNSLEVYDGSAWVGATGDLTALTAGSGISITSPTGPVPTVALDLASANVFTAAQTATRFIVTGSTIATNGVYLPATNSVAFSTNSTERMRIDATGRVGIGATPAVGDILRIEKTLDGSTSSQAVNLSVTIASDVTLNARGFNSFLSTAASAFTLSNMVHYRANQNTIGAGSTVTNQIGFNAEGTLIGATNNYGFYGAIASGTNRWNFYAQGSAGNYFAGRTGVGILLTSTAQFGVTNIQSATDVTMITRNFAAQTADSWAIQNSAGSSIFAVTAAGWFKYISGNTATTVGAAGGASALPLTPTGYLKIDIGGTEYKVPYYAA
jgi:hypothetical protein